MMSVRPIAAQAASPAQARPLDRRELSEEQAEIAQLPWMIRLTVACLVATVLGWLLSLERFALPQWLPWLLYAVAYVTGGFYSIQEAWDTLKRRQFDVNFLMIIAAVGAALVGQPREVAAPGGEPALGLGQMRARHLLALGPCLLDLGQLGRELAVLPVLLIPLQGHTHCDRDHV